MVLSKNELGSLVKTARQIKSKNTGIKYTQKMLAKEIGISRGYIGDIELGRTYPNYVLLNKIAQACEVPFSFFSDADEEIKNQMNDELKKENELFDSTHIYENDSKNALSVAESNSYEQCICNTYKPIEKSKKLLPIPILGVIRAGEPIYAEQNIISHEYLPEDLVKGGEYFGLKVTGDSMNLSHILDGQTVIVRRQEDVENGEIAVVLVDGENATIKRIYKTNNTVTLMPHSSNPKHLPRLIDITKIDFKILGKAIKVLINL